MDANLLPQDPKEQKEVIRYTYAGTNLTSTDPARSSKVPVKRLPEQLLTSFCVMGYILCGWGLMMANIILLETLPVLGTVLPMVILSALLIMWSRGRSGQITVSSSGIKFPPAFLPGLGGRSERGWSELKAVDLDSSTPATTLAEETKLTLVFKDGKRAKLGLSRIPAADLSTLYHALKTWCPIDDPRIDLLSAQAEYEREHSAEYSLDEFQVMTENFGPGCYPLATKGSSIGDYTVSRVVAAGGISALYEAHSATGAVLSLREVFIPDQCTDRTEIFRQLLSEANRLTELSPPHMPKLVDSFQVDNWFYYALDTKPSYSLRALVPTWIAPAFPSLPLKDSDTLAVYCRMLAETLVYLHEQSPAVLHGALTPGNINPRGQQLLLTDFGFANRIVSQASGQVIGDPNYLAPEIFNNQYSRAADIYALGATIAFFYRTRDPKPLTRSQPSIHQKRIPAKLDELVMRCTALNPADRPDAPAVLDLLVNEIFVSAKTAKSLATPLI